MVSCRAIICMLLVALCPALGSAATPDSVVTGFERAIAALDDYQCRVQEYAWQGSVSEAKVINFYFKKPRLIRVDVLTSNKRGDAGSVGVLRGDGKVVGRRGGLLGAFAFTFDKHDPLVATVRGASFDEIDLRGLAERFRRHLTEGSGSLLEAPGVYELVLEPRSGQFTGGMTREVLRLSTDTFLPLSADSYEGARIVEHAAWMSFILNAGLPAALFNVWWDPARLAAMVIATLPPGKG